MKAIKTKYKNTWFRSKLEADWAHFLGYNRFTWAYETEGYVFEDGVCYLPDFYLPDQDSFFEVKGIMTDFDEHKIRDLAIESQKTVYVGLPGGRLEAYNCNGEKVNEGGIRFYWVKINNKLHGFMNLANGNKWADLPFNSNVFSANRAYYDLKNESNNNEFISWWNKTSKRGGIF